MFPWSFLRSRECGGNRSRVIQHHLHLESLKDTIIEFENEERSWWNAALSPERPRDVKMRADLIRQCHVEIRKQSKHNNKKRKRNVEHGDQVYDEVVID